jgi:hypothetical protein
MASTNEPSNSHNAGIGRALGRVPSGLFILSVGTKPAVQAVLVSWV